MVLPARGWEGGLVEKRIKCRRLFERASLCVNYALTLLCTFCAFSIASQDTRPFGNFDCCFSLVS